MSKYVNLNRGQFRDYFQPSRLVLLLVKNPNKSGVNIITIAFNMYCSYSPAMFAFAIEKKSYTSRLLSIGDDCTLCIPSKEMVKETIFCGTHSGAFIDKASELNLQLVKRENHSVPYIDGCLAFMESTVDNIVPTGDHYTIISKVKNFCSSSYSEKGGGLLSIGSNIKGYNLLAEHGIHRIATIDVSAQ